jgi:hypothetical protein
MILTAQFTTSQTTKQTPTEHPDNL